MNHQHHMFEAARYLEHHDPVLAPVIAASGLCTIRPHSNYYQELVESIIGQQLSLKAAATITRRFLNLYKDQFPTPEAILATPLADFRSAGLSGAKAGYVRSLAEHVLDGRVRFGHLETLPDEAIVDELSQVKGIGVWTAHMFLIFCMGRSDVLPYGDLGIRAGIKRLYGYQELPNKDQVEEVARRGSWSPYRSIASWYVWKAIDTPSAKDDG